MTTNTFRCGHLKLLDHPLTYEEAVAHCLVTGQEVALLLPDRAGVICTEVLRGTPGYDVDLSDTRPEYFPVLAQNLMPFFSEPGDFK